VTKPSQNVANVCVSADSVLVLSKAPSSSTFSPMPRENLLNIINPASHTRQGPSPP
ncbi:MAG: hypothetical protein L6R37_008231, partial [Teloschistes peruensis]